MIFLFYTTLYLASSLGTLSIAFLTYRSSRTLQNKYFALFASTISGWLLLQFAAQLSYSRPGSALTLLRLAVALTPLISYAFLLFASEYVGKQPMYKKLLLFPPFVIFVGCMTPYMIESATITRYGIAIKSAGPLYILNILYAVIVFGIGLTSIYKSYRATKKDIHRTGRSRMLLLGFLQLVIVTVGGSVFLANNAASQLLLPISAFIMVAMIAYAVVIHRLFDIRLVVARSLGYILSIGVIMLLFLAASYLLTNIILASTHITDKNTRLIYTVIAGLLAFIFNPVKNFFDKLTNNVFYRDAYDTQAFLDSFNQTLVATYDLIPLLKQSAVLIEESIRPSYCVIVINRTDTMATRSVGGTAAKKLAEEDMRQINQGVRKYPGQILMNSELAEDKSALKKILQDHNIDMVAKLAVTATELSHEIGYILLGNKKSGNPYSSQDMKVMEIVSNELVIAIQNALRIEEINNFNKTLEDKVDEATKELRKANEKLKALDETKDDFISMASHQLRTPLTSVKGYISMVLEEDAGKINKVQHDMLGQAFQSSQRMVYLIADLLNVSRLKTGKFIIERVPVDLAEIVQQEMAQLKETAASRSLTVDYDEPENFPKLMLDETKTRQIIMNFVDNAIYYTPAGGHIDVKLIDKASTIELRVEDNGIGVPKNEQPHLFTKFYRAGNARKARPDGTGLGLFMAKKVIVAQGGTLLFESKEGKGSTFGFIFSKTKFAAPDS